MEKRKLLSTSASLQDHWMLTEVLCSTPGIPDCIHQIIWEINSPSMNKENMLAVVQRIHTTVRHRRAAIEDYRERIAGTMTTSRRRSLRATMAAKKHWQALAEVRFPRQFWVDERSSDWWENFVWARWDDDHWIANFRMSRGTFFELVEALRGRMERQVTGMRRPVPVEKRVAAALWYLATPQYFWTVAQQFGLRVTTVGDILKEFCLAMEAELFSKVVCLRDHLGASMDGFARLGFPHCFAAVDGSHIPIRAPGGSIKEYGNRKDFCSVLLQGTVDFSGRFIDAEVGWSGRRHDALVFRESNLRKAMDEGVFVPGNPTATIEGVRVPALVLGDGVYPLRCWLMTPYKRPRTDVQSHYNLSHSRARNVVERAFGRLKSRFHCLMSRLHVHIDNVTPLIIACVILHNICEDKGHNIPFPVDEPDPVVLEDTQDIPEARKKRIYAEGCKVRDAIATHIYRNRRRV
ncbi:M-phase inducer phosphatase 3 isoform X3 [Paroedura picta]|uniref:M-phase inducer phosphatase 3 isoform X3 n=1 Tax=Paroedura picta TaxID=143630 RepID=UPI004055F586